MNIIQILLRKSDKISSLVTFFDKKKTIGNVKIVKIFEEKITQKKDNVLLCVVASSV